MTDTPKKKTGPRTGSDEHDPTIRKARWAAMKEEFLELSVTGGAIHWPTLSAKYGFDPATARNKASVNKWYSEIETRRKMREEVLSDHLTKRTAMALDELNRDFATNEAAIRKKHATMARGLQGRAIRRLNEIPLEQFTARDALAMLKLGIDEERFALGLKQTFEGDKSPPMDSGFQPLVEQIGGHQKVQKIGMLLLKAMKDIPLDEGSDDLTISGLGPTDVEPKSETVVDKPVYKPVPPATPVPPSATNVKIKKASS